MTAQFSASFRLPLQCSLEKQNGKGVEAPGSSSQKFAEYMSQLLIRHLSGSQQYMVRILPEPGETISNWLIVGFWSAHVSALLWSTREVWPKKLGPYFSFNVLCIRPSQYPKNPYEGLLNLKLTGSTFNQFRLLFYFHGSHANSGQSMVI